MTFSEPGLPVTRDAGGEDWRGLRIVGAEPGLGVFAAGDVNGDGLADVALPDGESIAVVYGRGDGAVVDLATLGDAGFRIRRVSAVAGWRAGRHCEGLFGNSRALAAAGDLNGDGRDDLVFMDHEGLRGAYSPPAGSELDADELGAAGFTAQLPQAAYDVSLGWIDGRLLAKYDDPAGGHVAAIDPPPAGTTVAAGERTAFAVEVPRGRVEIWGERRHLAVVHAPPAGTSRTLPLAEPAHGAVLEAGTPDALDVGDQDGDGRADMARGGALVFTAGPGGPIRD